MHIFKTKIFLFFILLLFSLPACDAPRNNPFDPYNSDSPFVILEGKITSSFDSKPLSDVKITFLPYKISEYTNAEGLFSFDDFERVDGWVKIEKSGCFADSVYIEWGDARKKSLSSALCYKPKVNNLLYYSVVQNRTAQQGSDYILIKTKINELGNEIDSVFLRSSDQYIKTMGFNISTKYFETTVNAQELGFVSLDQIIGNQIELIVTNSNSQETITAIMEIQRVIRSEIEIESPSAQDEVYLPINFTWKKYTPGFQFSYLLQIFTNEIEPQLISQKAFSSFNDSYLFGSYLDPGEYFWVLWCIDEFGNRNRSKPQSFTLR